MGVALSPEEEEAQEQGEAGEVAEAGEAGEAAAATEVGEAAVAEAAAAEAAEAPTPQLVLRTEPSPEKAAGFGGLPDPYSGHYFGESEQVGNDGKRVLQDSRGLAATKAATAMTFAESLARRSG